MTQSRSFCFQNEVIKQAPSKIFASNAAKRFFTVILKLSKKNSCFEFYSAAPY